MAEPTGEGRDRLVNALPIKSEHARWVHIYVAGRNTACGHAVNIDRWTVLARHLVPDKDWCPRCWNKVLA